MKLKTSFYSGMFGGGIVIALFLIFLFSLNLFNYSFHIEKININNAQLAENVATPDINPIFQRQLLLKEQLLIELKKDRSILTPQEYTNNIVNYYNNLLLILSVMLAAFSALSFVYIKSLSRDLIQDKLQSNEFQEQVGNKLLGQAENNFRDYVADLQKKIKQLEDKAAEQKELNYAAEEEEDTDDKEIE